MAWLSVFLLVIVLVAIGLAVQGVSIYNGLVQVKHQVDQAWSNIDVLLKQRHDELPKLVDALKGYVAHERGLLESVEQFPDLLLTSFVGLVHRLVRDRRDGAQ